MSNGHVAVLLVAGVGERLRPLTADRPKALMDLGGETILSRAVRLLVQCGVSELIFATGYREDAVKQAVQGCPVPVQFCRNDAYDRTQNSVSLWHCANAISGRPFFKLDGDLVFSSEVLKRLEKPGSGIATAVEYRNDLGAEEMKVTVDSTKSWITNFGKHLDPAQSYGESIGLELVGSDAVGPLFSALSQSIEKHITSLYYEDIYARLIKQGTKAPMVDVSDLGWCEIDTLSDLENARELLRSGRVQD